jgi:hypothetical protein
MVAHPLFCALNVGGDYQNVSADVHQGSAVRVRRGAKDESGGLTASKVELRLLDLVNAAPTYDPDHPLSPWYGLAGQNTQMILGLDLVVETFESVTPAVPRVDAGTAFWARSTTDAHSGTWSLKAGTITHSQVSDVTLTTPAAATMVQFWYKVSSASGDGLQVLVDGVNLAVNQAGISAWTQKTYKVNPGGTIRFRYTKDAAGSGGSDTAWIDDIRYYNSRSLVETSSWKPDEELAFAPQVPGPGKGVRWTDLQGEGLLRRINQWKDSLRSPVFRQVSARASSGRLLGYWPGEDRVGSTGLSNAMPGGQPGLATGVTYQAGPALSGTDALLKIGTSSKLSGRFLKPTGAPNGWQISWAFQLDATAPVTDTQLITWTTTNGYRWFLQVSSTQYTLLVTAGDGVTVLSVLGAGFSGTGDPVSQGIVFRVKVSAAAGTVTAETAWYSQDNPFVFGITQTFPGTTGNLLSWAVGGNLATDGMTFGHVYGVAGTTDDLQDYDTLNAFDGYRGELAGDRFLRLCGYAKVFGFLIGNAADTQPMGPQRSGRIIDLLKEIQVTEDGPIFDAVWRTGLYLRTRKSMLNQTAKLTLPKAQCAKPLTKVTDDLVSGNRVTVRNRTGGEATYEVLTGPGSTQDPPNGVGLYEQTVDVNVADDADLDEIAGRWAYKLSDTTARYSSVTVDLDAQPGLETAVGLVDIGDRIFLSDVRPGGAGLIVLGYADNWDTKFRRTWTAVCAPDTLYNPARYDTAGVKYDSRSTTLAVARDAVQTSWSISTTDPEDPWSTTGVPYGWTVDGETMTVTAMTAAAGAGPYTQTATVTRGTNGAPKAHAVGAEIHISPRERYG